jgi:hypothetical protein
MHNKDIKLGRITENDLLSEDLINEAMIGRHKLQLEYENKIIECEYGIMTNKQYINLKVSILKNSLEWKETVGKRTIEKFKLTVSNNIINEDGETLKLSKHIANKSAKTMSTVYLDEDGNETCIDKEQGKLKTKIYEDSTTYYVIKNAITGEVFSHGMNLRDINKLCGTLFVKDKTNYLGLNKGSKTQFINSGKEFLIGLYVEK